MTANIIRAARNWHIWGRFATAAYCRKRGIPLQLVRLARQLESMKGE